MLSQDKKDILTVIDTNKLFEALLKLAPEQRAFAAGLIQGLSLQESTNNPQK